MNKEYYCTVSGLRLPGTGQHFVNGKMVLDDRGNIDHVLVAMESVPIETAEIKDQEGNLLNGTLDLDSMSKDELITEAEKKSLDFSKSWKKEEILKALKGEKGGTDEQTRIN